MTNRKYVGILLVILLVFSLMSVLVFAQQKTINSGAKAGSKKDTGTTIFFLQSMKKGELQEFRINKRALPVNKISFIPKKNYAGDIQINIRRTYDFPTRDFPKLVDAHSYFEINTVNFKPEFFTSIKIDFVVERQWLTVRKSEENNLSLYRFANGSWKELSTSFDEKIDNSVFYSAITPGFSYFAIALSGLGKEDIISQNISLPEENFFTNETQDIIEEIFNEETSFIDNIQEDSLPTKVKNTLVYWAIIILIMLFFYLISRIVKRKDEKNN